MYFKLIREQMVFFVKNNNKKLPFSRNMFKQCLTTYCQHRDKDIESTCNDASQKLSKLQS